MINEEWIGTRKKKAPFVAFYDMRAVMFVLPDEMADVMVLGLQWFSLILWMTNDIQCTMILDKHDKWEMDKKHTHKKNAPFVILYDMRAVMFVLPDEMAGVMVVGPQWFILIPRLNHTGSNRSSDSCSKLYLLQENKMCLCNTIAPKTAIFFLKCNFYIWPWPLQMTLTLVPADAYWWDVPSYQIRDLQVN